MAPQTVTNKALRNLQKSMHALAHAPKPHQSTGALRWTLHNNKYNNNNKDKQKEGEDNNDKQQQHKTTNRMLWMAAAHKPAMYMVILEKPLHQACKLDIWNTVPCTCTRPQSQTEVTNNQRGLNHVINFSGGMQGISERLGMTLNFEIVEERNFLAGQSLHACIIGPFPDENTADNVLKLEYFAQRLTTWYNQFCQQALSTGTLSATDVPWFQILPQFDSEGDYGNVYHFYLNDDLSIDGKYYSQHLKPSDQDPEASNKNKKTDAVNK